jgi:hypothetical protein
MISEFKTIEAQFNELNKFLKAKVEIYVIGGAVLLYHGLKPATKDIDIVVDTEKEFRALEKDFKEIGYEIKIPGLEYKHMDLNQIFVKGDMRIDLFQRTVCSRFFLSESMKKRAINVINQNNLTVNLCSKEDIFLFKTMTDREGDIEDCMALFQRGLEWESIVSELRHQAKETGHDVWITWVAERLETLEEKGVPLPKPFMEKVYALVDEYYDYLEKVLPEKNNKSK